MVFQHRRQTLKEVFGKFHFYKYVEKCGTQEQYSKCNEIVSAVSIVKLLMMMAGCKRLKQSLTNT
jgi:hypothetical protein